MKLYTLRIANYKAAIRESLLLYDTTVKSGGNSPFKPTWDIVLKHKDGKITDKEYTDIYLDLMRESYTKRKKEWIEFLKQERAVVACYCKSECFCHRFLLADILAKVAKHHDIPFQYLGELE